MKAILNMLSQARDNKGEPMFAVRAQDKYALETIEFYQGLVKKDKMVTKKFLDEIQIKINQFEEWRNSFKDKVKIPD